MSRQRITIWLLVQLIGWIVGGYCRYYGPILGELFAAILILDSYRRISPWVGTVTRAWTFAGSLALALDWFIPNRGNAAIFFDAAADIQICLAFGIFLIWLGELSRQLEVTEPKK